MLKLFGYDDRDASDCLAVLNNAGDTKVTREINGAYTLEFTYPQDEKAELLTVNRLVQLPCPAIYESAEGAIRVGDAALHV